jgi:hypothetical protein
MPCPAPPKGGVAVMTMSYKATLDAIERRLAESKRKLAESCAPNPFIPEGYCTLATAVDRAAAAYFPQKYGATEISPQQRDRLARHHLAIEDIKHLDAWERDAERLRRHAENARRASAGNVNSVPRKVSVHWAETSLPARPMSEDQEKAARLDAIEDDEVMSIRQLTERRASLIEAAWMQLRQHLHRGRLVGFHLGDHGGHPKEMEAGQWSARWFENARKQDAFWSTLVREDKLAALLGGDQPQENVTAGSVAVTPQAASPSAPIPYERGTKAETEAAYKNWIAQHEGRTPPSRDEDIRHMKGRFPKIPRNRVRELRNRLAPGEWVQQGRRSKIGTQKLAEKG